MPRGPRSRGGGGDRFRAGRREEGRDVHARYYALNDHPSATAFGAPDFVDSLGRQYRVAYAGANVTPLPGQLVAPRPANAAAVYKPTERDRLKLWVKLPRKVHRFGPLASRDLWFASTTSAAATVTLEPVAPGLPRVQVRVREAYRAMSGHRTGHVYVTGLRL